jgi:hypothetical protein
MTVHRSENAEQEEQHPFTMISKAKVQRHSVSGNASPRADGGPAEDGENSDEEETESVEARRKISILLERFDTGLARAMTSPEEFERAQREIQSNYVVDLARGRVSDLPTQHELMSHSNNIIYFASFIINFKHSNLQRDCSSTE